MLKAIPPLGSAIARWRRALTPRSLQWQLTVGIATLAALGVGGVITGLSWHLDTLIVSSHKEQVRNLAKRFEQTVEIYGEMLPDAMVLQKAIDHLSTGDTLIWVTDLQGEIIAQSEIMKLGGREESLLHVNAPKLPPDPRVRSVGQGHWVVCGQDLVFRGTTLGKVNIAHDITGDHLMFQRLVWTLGATGVGAIALLILAIALYIRRALRPLQAIQDATASISIDTLDQAPILIAAAPSEIAQLSIAFNRMLLRLHDSWEQQHQFVSNVSHELRTPLTLVAGYLQSTLRRATNLSEPQRDALNIAASEAERTVQLLEDLLDLARADSGHFPLHCEPLALEPFITEVADMVRQYSDRPLQVEISRPAPVAIADPNRLKQVLLNLIDNAVKYSEAGEPVAIAAQIQGDKAEMQVRDRGIGIPLSHQARLFERFYRVDDSRCRTTGGTGLGLSIVKTLVDGMGGRVSVRSRPGHGSTFIITLPLAADPTHPR